MGSLRPIRTAMLGIAITLPLFGSPAAAGSAIRYVDDDGRVGRRGCDGGISVPTRIQRAIDASGSGDTVKVCPGTYRGKVVIGEHDNGIKLVAATDTRPTLRPARSGATAVLVVRGARNVLVEHLRFLPHGGTGRCTEVREFIRVRGDATVRIVDNVLDGVRPYATSCTRFGLGVLASSPASTHQRVEVVGNVVRDFRQAAVWMVQLGEYAEPGAVLRVTDNRFLVRHPQGSNPFVFAAVNAHFGGRAVIQDNVMRVARTSRRMVGFVDASFMEEGMLIRRNLAEGVASGIKASPMAPRTARIEDNTLRGRTFRGHPELDDHYTLVGLYVYGNETYVARNRVTGFTYEGIYSERAEAVVEDNDFRGNGGIDCRDPDYVDGESWGVWRRNLGHEADPPGLCSPPAPPHQQAGS